MTAEIFDFEHQGALIEGELVDWVMTKTNHWRDYYEVNYSYKHREYNRLFRNIWSPEDVVRQSERSRLIAPALAQAVEANVAEVEEATFGRGQIFDIKDDFGGQDPQQIEYLRNKLHDDFEKCRLRSSVSECLINAAVYGVGIGEIVIEDMMEVVPATRPLPDGTMSQVGVETKYRPMVKLNPVQPQSFLIDPNAASIEEALGVAVDEFVSRHTVELLQEDGTYRDDVYIGEAADDYDIENNHEEDSNPRDKIRLLKYYGLVPRKLLIDAGVDEEDIDSDSEYVESVVVIANEAHILKALPTPYMAKDRPVVAFSWDIVPNLFWGRGVCEKGYMAQKALDTELRARIDALALTTHPMIAMDATRIPRNHNLEVRPGKIFLTNGPPAEAVTPFHFGQLDSVSFNQSQTFQNMVSQATSAGDAQLQGSGQQTASGMSMALSAIVKRQKRTLLNFQENFLIPFVRKAAYRYMQFDPENYPVQDFQFIPFSSLGAMAREYEVQQLSQILQVVEPESPAHGAVIMAIVDHLNVGNRESIVAAIQQGNQPDPQAQQMAMEQAQRQNALLDAQIALTQSEAGESQARALKSTTDAQLAPTELTLKYSDQNNDGVMDPDFERRIRVAELLLKEQEIAMRHGQIGPAGSVVPPTPQQPQPRPTPPGGPNVPPRPPQGPTGA